VALGLGMVSSCGPAPAPPSSIPPRPTPRPVATQKAQHNPPADHAKDRKGVRHKSGSKQALQNCAPCHGADLKGKGPAAPAFKVPPTDLTTFAKRHGGTFSALDLETAITSKGQPVPAHGSPNMPVWGPIFKSISPDDGDLVLRVSNLVKYIESLQVK